MAASLKIRAEQNSVQVYTPSTTLLANLHLDSPEIAEFVTTQLGALTYRYLREQGELRLFGPLEEVSQALKSLKVNFVQPEKRNTLSFTLTVTDNGLNSAAVSHNDYVMHAFHENHLPSFNNTLLPKSITTRTNQLLTLAGNYGQDLDDEHLTL